MGRWEKADNPERVEGELDYNLEDLPGSGSTKPERPASKNDTERLLRDLIMRALAERVADQGTQSSQRLTIKASFGGGTCVVEGALEYSLPDGRKLSHKTDILLTVAQGRRIAVELKFLSTVSDQFKARAYDMRHIKQTHGGVAVGARLSLPHGSR